MTILRSQNQLFTQVRKLVAVILGLCLLVTASVDTQAQERSEESSTTNNAIVSQISDKVEVEPRVSDADIAQRLIRIMDSTDWFIDLNVQVNEGVVFLDGRTTSAGFRDWATELAQKTRDVVAVVNRLHLIERSAWELSPAWDEIQHLWKQTIQQLPRLGLGLLILVAALLIAILLAGATRRTFAQRLKPLLCDLAARAVFIPVILLGVYLMLKVGGLSGLAATVLGGTGLIGLVAGIAFRDILENYLASILISLRNPFKFDDLVEIAGHTGIVQRVTTRGTVLMNLDGNHVQIPNAVVYKSIILNYTANPNRRETFTVGIGYENEVAMAQDMALKVLASHPAVLKDPEALVLVDQFGAATVNLRVSFWYEGTTYNGPKIKSSVIRLVKRTFEQHGISMPDEAREVIFPQGVPVHMVEHVTKAQAEVEKSSKQHATVEPDMVKVSGEGDFTSEEKPLRKQARQARIPEEGVDLLE
ncbi:MAG: mechanosensitive ion channel family protein [Desulfuromonadales bacterium]|nr:mechanosensitive ion channel family protein [Desulfuromonadales bacterium]